MSRPREPPAISAFPATRRSLLARLGERAGGAAGDEATDAAWMRFTEDYEAGLLRFVRGRGLQEADARDVVQEVLLAVHAALRDLADGPEFGGPGAFRAWLGRVAFHKSVDAVRRRAAAAKLGAAAGGTAGLGLLAAVPDGDAADAAADADPDEVERRRWAFCVAAGRVEAEVEPHTWAAFAGTAVDGRPAAEVAAELDMTVGAVYAAKCRTLARLRAVAATLDLDERGETS